jgi:hypothetical protein
LDPKFNLLLLVVATYAFLFGVLCGARAPGPEDGAMPHFRQKPIVVEAVQWFPGVEHPRVRTIDGRAVILTEGGLAWPLVPGTWIVTRPDGRGYFLASPDLFDCAFEPDGPDGPGDAVVVPAATVRFGGLGLLARDLRITPGQDGDPTVLAFGRLLGPRAVFDAFLALPAGAEFAVDAPDRPRQAYRFAACAVVPYGGAVAGMVCRGDPAEPVVVHARPCPAPEEA